jgi:hypothetical protein
VTWSAAKVSALLRAGGVGHRLNRDRGQRGAEVEVCVYTARPRESARRWSL